MKSFLSLSLMTLLALLLSGCPDARIPKPPPKIPLPKEAASAPHDRTKAKSMARGPITQPGFASEQVA